MFQQQPVNPELIPLQVHLVVQIVQLVLLVVIQLKNHLHALMVLTPLELRLLVLLVLQVKVALNQQQLIVVQAFTLRKDRWIVLLAHQDLTAQVKMKQFHVHLDTHQVVAVQLVQFVLLVQNAHYLPQVQ